jgi:hypothetical protein
VGREFKRPGIQNSEPGGSRKVPPALTHKAGLHMQVYIRRRWSICEGKNKESTIPCVLVHGTDCKLKPSTKREKEVLCTLKDYGYSR